MDNEGLAVPDEDSNASDRNALIKSFSGGEVAYSFVHLFTTLIQASHGNLAFRLCRDCSGAGASMLISLPLPIYLFAYLPFLPIDLLPIRLFTFLPIYLLTLIPQHFY